MKRSGLVRSSIAPAWPYRLPSNMNRPVPHRERGLLDRLRHGRMSVAGAGEVLRRAAELHQDRDFVNEFTRAEANNMRAENAVSRGVGQNLDEALGAAH